MKKILTFALALIASASLMAKDVTCINLYRYIYTDYATGDPYYSVQFGDEDWNSYYFGFKDAVGPMIGQIYTMDDMIAEQTYASINYKQDPITTVSFQRNYEGLQEQFAISVTTESGAQYNLTWAAAAIPTKVEPVDLDTTIACDFMDNGPYKTFTPLVKDYNYYDFTIAIAGDLPAVNEQKKYTWKANTVYIGNANFQLPGDWNTKPFDATFTINGVEGGYEGIAEYSMTDGKKYTFNFSYTTPHADETVYLTGYDLKIQTNWDKTVSFSWQNDTYSAQLPINSTDTLGNWKGNDIILNNCSFYQNPYINLGVYAIDSIYVTRTEEGYIRLQTSILCKNNTLYVLDVTNQESPYYVKYDTDGTGVKWQNIPASQYGTGRTMGVRYNNDSIWFNAEPTDEGALGYSIKETYGTYGDPLWAKDSITISYDLNTSWGSPLSVYMAEKYYDAELNVNLSSRSYENVDGDGVWNYDFSYGSYMEGNHYSFKFGIICPITAPAQYRTYTLDDMTEDYRTKGYDPEYNEIKYDVVTLYRELVWPANDAEKFTINVHTTDGKAYKLIYAADTIPVAADTTEFLPIKAKISQEEYWFQFTGDATVNDMSAQYHFQIALVGAEVNPTTFYWKDNTFYKPNTSIYNSTTGTYVEIADAWAQVNVLKENEQNIGYSCDAWIVGYDSICYHAYLKYTVPVAKDTITLNMKNLSITPWTADNKICFNAFDENTRISIVVMGLDTLGEYSSDQVDAPSSNVGIMSPYSNAQGYSSEGVKVEKDGNGYIVVTGNLLCDDDILYEFTLSNEPITYYLGVKNAGGEREWTAMEYYESYGYKADYVRAKVTVVDPEGDVMVSTTESEEGLMSTQNIADIITLDEENNTVTVKANDVVEYYFSWYSYYIYYAIDYGPEPTGWVNVNVNADVNKFMYNGQLIIRKGDKLYNALGAELK